MSKCFHFKGKVSLTLRDMIINKEYVNGWTSAINSLVTIHTVGLYFIILVPSRGITLIWDKHTRISIELDGTWKVSDKNHSNLDELVPK